MIRRDATQDCNLVWENKINQEISELKLKLSEKDRVIADKDRRLLAAVAAADEAMTRAKEDLEKQRANEPLSKACSACRVPNSYIWLRGDKTKPATN
jgi:hypothetical protein